MAGHIVSRKVYVLVFAVLIALTALTTAAAYVDLDKVMGSSRIPWNTVVALVIAFCKASLVVMFFMHLRWSSHLVRLVGVAALFWLALLIALTVGDVFTRQWTPIPQSWQTSQSVPYH